MYINYNIAKAHNLAVEDIFYLCGIKQTEKDILETIPDDVLSRYETQSLLTSIKGSKTENPRHKIRLSDKGKSLLEDLETPEILEEDIKIFSWLKDIYIASGKELGNQKKTKLFIALFRVHSGISKNSLAYLCQSFINDESQFEWSKKLEFLLFKPANMYEKFNIEGSRLYQYYIKNQEQFDNKFQTLN